MKLREYLLNENQDMEISGIYSPRHFDKELDNAGIHYQYSGRRYTIYDVDNKLQDKVIDIIRDIVDNSRDIDTDEVMIRLRGKTFTLNDFK